MTKLTDKELRTIGLSAGVFNAGTLMFAFTSAAVWEKSAHFCHLVTAAPGVILRDN